MSEVLNPLSAVSIDIDQNPATDVLFIHVYFDDFFTATERRRLFEKDPAAGHRATDVFGLRFIQTRRDHGLFPYGHLLFPSVH